MPVTWASVEAASVEAVGISPEEASVGAAGISPEEAADTSAAEASLEDVSVEAAVSPRDHSGVDRASAVGVFEAKHSGAQFPAETVHSALRTVHSAVKDGLRTAAIVGAVTDMDTIITITTGTRLS